MGVNNGEDELVRKEEGVVERVKIYMYLGTYLDTTHIVSSKQKIGGAYWK